MEKAESELLTEVRRLSDKKNDLERDIKKNTRWLTELENSQEKHRKDVKEQSEKLKKLRKEESDIMCALADEKKAISVKKTELDRKAKGLTEIAEENVKRSEQALADEKKAGSRIAEIKVKLSELKDRESKVLSVKNNAEERLAELKRLAVLEQKQSENRLAALDVERADIEKDNEALAQSKAKLVQDYELLKKRREELSEGSLNNHRDAKANEEKEAVLKGREEEVVKAREKNEAAALSNSRVRAALEQEKKEINLMRLRVEKLAKEKQVDKELAELRNEK